MMGLTSASVRRNSSASLFISEYFLNIGAIVSAALINTKFESFFANFATLMQESLLSASSDCSYVVVSIEVYLFTISSTTYWNNNLGSFKNAPFSISYIILLYSEPSIRAPTVCIIASHSYTILIDSGSSTSPYAI